MALYVVHSTKIAPQWALYCVLLDRLSGIQLLLPSHSFLDGCVAAAWLFQLTVICYLRVHHTISFETTTRGTLRLHAPIFCPCWAIQRALTRDRLRFKCIGTTASNIQKYRPLAGQPCTKQQLLNYSVTPTVTNHVSATFLSQFYPKRIKAAKEGIFSSES